MLLFENIVVGPIHSRRLGTSLGVNVLPTQKKYCSFNCVYCECGWNEIDTSVQVKFNSKEDIHNALEKYFTSTPKQDIQKIDSITFSGNGEPTLHPDILEIVKDVISFRDTYAKRAKVTILTNSTNIVRDDVFQALNLIDNPILKLDAGTEEMYKRINKPVSCTLSQIKSSLIKFGNKAIIQTMLLRGIDNGKLIDNTTEEEFSAWLKIVKEINPREVMLYTIDRETPDKDLEKLSLKELEPYANKVKALGIKVKTY
ncbi:MAG: radical SAM protein [Bacteroidales bacterium]|jgi:wyosine [tRNA(Phe)-imidazoG37] synthetase (radical SAM superfamily)|nr:radical SAM protein [Bacteroidales bacterium]